MLIDAVDKINQQNVIMRYLSIYLSSILGKTTQLLNNDSDQFNLIKISTHDYNEIDLINIILRLKIILSVYKTYIISRFPKHLLVMRFSEFTINFDSKKNQIFTVI